MSSAKKRFISVFPSFPFALHIKDKDMVIKYILLRHSCFQFQYIRTRICFHLRGGWWVPAVRGKMFSLLVKQQYMLFWNPFFFIPSPTDTPTLPLSLLLLLLLITLTLNIWYSIPSHLFKLGFMGQHPMLSSLSPFPFFLCQRE